MPTPRDVAEFVQALQRAPRLPGIFNQYAQFDPNLDASSSAPDVRCEQLHQYLSDRLGHAKLCLQAEAAGYQGARFSGIPMTSERILLGHHDVPKDIVMKATTKRTSRMTAPKGVRIPSNGFTEPTASIVWRSIRDSGASSVKVVLANTFPFHPLGPKGPLSNGRPCAEHLVATRGLLEHFYRLFPNVLIVPVGRVAEATLQGLGVPSQPYVRHPAYRGANEFRQGMASYYAAVNLRQPAGRP